MRLRKTTVMCNKHANKYNVIADEKKIEEGSKYVYLGQMVTLDQN